MTTPSPARYRTTNWTSYNAALRKRGSLLIWLDKEMTWLAPPEGRTGRPPVFSDVAIQVCLSIKGLFKLPLRQTAGMVASPARGWRVWTGRCRTIPPCAAGRRRWPSRSPPTVPMVP